MDSRRILLLGALALVGAGVIALAQSLWDTPPAAARMSVAIAVRPIRPYTIISQDMVKVGDAITLQDAVSRGAYPAHAVVGLMSTAQIAPGTMLTGVNARPVEDVRFVSDPNLEIVTFSAGVDRTVGGQLRPGHLINLYGFGRDKTTNEAFTTLVEPRLWVVKVGSGGGPVTNATPRPDIDTGDLYYEGGDRESNATLITVAVTPQQAFHIIDTLGAEGMSAWATLAGSGTADVATPVAPTPGLTADTVATLEHLRAALQPTAAPTIGIYGYGGASR